MSEDLTVVLIIVLGNACIAALYYAVTGLWGIIQ